MLTLFSAPKPFRNHIGVIQMNALRSWVRLSPSCEIILFGDEEGISEAAAHIGVRHVPEVRRNEYGTPLLDDIFLKAQEIATREVTCYINADIILMSDFYDAVETIRKRKKSFLMVGKRWNITLEQQLDFSRPVWENQLHTHVRKSGVPSPPEWIDYFVFPRGFYRDLLPFAIGRAAFDNWLLWKARSLGARIIDASEIVMAVHQNHDYSHHPRGQKGVWEGPEAERNRELMGGWHHCFTLADATHRLTTFGLKLDPGTVRLKRLLWSRGIFAKWLQMMEWSYPVRNRLGLHKSNVDHFIRVMRNAFSVTFSRKAE